MAAPVQQGMSLDEFQRIWEEEGAFEYIDGIRIHMPSKMFVHGSAANQLARLMNEFTGREGMAYVEQVFVIPGTEDANWVKGSRIPDMMFFWTARLEAYKAANPDWREKPLALIPDIALEVTSRHDLYDEVAQKVRTYLQDGVKLVWLIEPAPQAVTIYTPTSNQVIVLYANDTLTGGDVIPGFAVQVGKLFE